MTYIENIPDWLTITDISGGNKIYSGTPTSITDQTSFEIIPVHDVSGLNYSQKFTISIIEPLSKSYQEVNVFDTSENFINNYFNQNVFRVNNNALNGNNRELSLQGLKTLLSLITGPQPKKK